MDDHGPSIRKFSLFRVHLSEEAEDATWLLRDAMVRPAEVLVVPDLATIFWLLKAKNQSINQSINEMCLNKQTQLHTQR